MDPSTIIALAASLGVLCVGLLFFGGGDGASKAGQRAKSIASRGQTKKAGLFSFIKNEDNSSRRKQIEESLGEIEQRQKNKKKASKTIKSKLMQANWTTTPQTFMTISIGLGLTAGAVSLIMGLSPVFCLGLAFVIGFGLPRWFLNFTIGRRHKKFTAHFADVPIDVCLERMYERVPLSEVNFFATVLNIQKTTGGNLGEALSNLSNVLRGRKMLREKIKALAAEAKMSAYVIGSFRWYGHHEKND